MEQGFGGGGRGVISASTTAARGCGGYKREGGRVSQGGEVAAFRWGRTILRGIEEENRGRWRQRGIASPPSLRQETKERREKRRGQRRRDQWTCAGVPRHHGDLLATSRNKMATLPFNFAERWRQCHVYLLLILFSRTCSTKLDQVLSPDKTVRSGASHLSRGWRARISRHFIARRRSERTRSGNRFGERAENCRDSPRVFLLIYQ